MAARDAAQPGGRRRVIAGRRLLLLPYVPVVLAVLESGHQLLTEGPADRLVLGVAAALVVLAFLRQLIALTHTADLLDTLAAREGDLLRQARSDPLTGLGNRVSLLTRLDAALERRSRTGTEVVVLYVDLDDFKLINDTHGHAAGDQVLIEVGRRLAALAGPGDTVARLGGDEFALLLVGVADPDAVAGQVLAALAEPVLLGSRRFAVRGSVGLVAAESPDDTSGLLMLHADIALYTAKQDGKGRVAAVRGAARQEAARRVRVRELVAHPDLAHFSVVYQPVVDLRDGRVRGVEALLRWQHPDVGAVPPDEFVPLAEQAGSIDVLGRFVLDTALADLAGWQAAHPGRRLQVGVNVSPVQLSDAELLPAALAALARHRLGPDQLALELTEQAIVGDLDAAAAAVLAMREAGLSVAIDDFGTGWSSLRYLDRFAADVLKVDRSFVASITCDERTRTLVRSVVDLAGMLDLRTIAEGVETVEHLRLLQAMGCELAQGYLFCRPVPAGEIDALLAAGGRMPVVAALPAPRTPVA